MGTVNLNGARERAEELLQTLQNRARTVWQSDAAAGVRTLVDEKGAPARRAFGETVAKVRDRAGPIVGRLLEQSPVASRADLEEMSRQVKSLNKKVNELAKKLNDSAQAS